MNLYEIPSEISPILHANLSKVFEKALSSLIPQPELPTAEWAEKYLRLPNETSDIAGPFSMHYVPHLWGIFKALDDPDIKEVVCMKAAQVGWTTAIIAYLLKKIDCDPSPMMAMFSAEQAGREFSQEKLQPTIDATPRIAERVITNKREGSSILIKRFQGGFLKLVGSNTPRSVKSTPAKIAIVEEPDDSTENLREQGDAILLLWERTKRVRNSKRILGGTPKTKGLSRVEKHLEASDKRVLPVECHECYEKHVLNFDNVTCLTRDDGIEHAIYGKELPDTAVYVCPHCGSPWDDYQRQNNIRNTALKALESGDDNGGWIATAEFNGSAGFHELGELYCCLPGTSLADLRRDYLDAEHRARHGDQNAKIVFVNSKLGRPYEFEGGQLDADRIRELADDSYSELECPRRGLLITIGIDVQHDRLAVIIKLWGREEECWTIYWGEIPAGNTTIDPKDAVWTALDQLVFAPFKHESGVNIYASAISIDSGDGATSDAVYSWVRSRQKTHPKVLVMAIKGSSAKTDPEIFVTPSNKSLDHKDPTKRRKSDKYGLKPYIVGTNKAKNWLDNQLKLLAQGIGKFHFYKGIRDDYADQMTGEVKAPHRSTPNRLIWQPRPGRAIEAWDCEQYALHAARAKRVHLMSPAQWDALETRLSQSDLFGAIPEPEQHYAPEQPAPASQKPNVINVGRNQPAANDSKDRMKDLARILGNG